MPQKSKELENMAMTWLKMSLISTEGLQSTVTFIQVQEF